MPSIARQGLQTLQRRLEAIDRILEPKPAEVPGSNDRQQVETEIGWRAAMRNDRVRVFLEVVRRKSVLFRGYEGHKESPGATRNQTEFHCLCRAGVFRGAVPGRRTDRASHQR